MRTRAIAGLSYAAAVLAAVYWLPLERLPTGALLLAALGALLFARRRRWQRSSVRARSAAGRSTRRKSASSRPRSAAAASTGRS